MGKISFSRGDGGRDSTRVIMLVVIVLASFFVRSIDCQSACADMVLKYYECSYLSMTNSSESDFTPELTPGNILTDALLRCNSKLDTMTLGQAIQLFGQIYKESQCKTYKCDCIRSKINNPDEIDYSPFFNSPGALRGLEIMIDQLNKERSLTKSPESEIEDMYSSPIPTPSLTSLCSKYEFGDLRPDLYTNWFRCTRSIRDDETYDWFHASFIIDNRANFSLSTMSQRQLENYIIYRSLTYKNCPIAVQRFAMMSTWVDDVKNLKWSGGNSASYFDGLARRSRGNPPIDFNITELYTGDDEIPIIIYNFRDQEIQIEPETEITTFQICLKTRLLQIDCLIDWNDDDDYYFIDRIVVTFYFPDNTTARNSFVSYTFNYEDIADSSVERFDEGYYERTPSNRANLFYSYISDLDYGEENSMFLNDFRSNIFFYYIYYDLYVVTPLSLIRDATGFLVDGILR